MKKILIPLLFLGVSGILVAQNDTLKGLTDKTSTETTNYLNALKFFLNGDTETAKYILINIISVNPKQDAASFELARIYLLEGNYIEAIKYGESAANLQPNNFYYQKLLLEIYQAAGEADKAIELIKNIIQKWPDKISMLYQYKKALVDNKRYKEAVQVVDFLIAKDPTNEDLVLEKFNLLRYLGNDKKAEKVLNDFIEATPCPQKSPLFLSNYYFDNKQDKKALKVLESLLLCDSLNDIANLTMAEYYHKKGKRKETFNYLKNAFKNPDIAVSSKMNYIINFYPIENSKEDPELNQQLITLVQIIAHTHPSDPDAQRICGDVLYIEKQFEKASEYYEKLLALGMYQYQSVENLMLCYYNLNKTKDLNRIARRAMSEYKFMPLPHYFMGIYYFTEKQHELAIHELEMAVNYGTDMPELLKACYTALGDLYGYVKNYDRSYDYYEKVLQMDSLNALVLNNYAYSLAERNLLLDKALEMSRKSLRIDDQQASFLDTYGWILFRLGQYQEALEYIGKALKLNTTEDAVLCEHYGDVLYKLGMINEAREYWQKAALIGKGSEKLLKKIETGDYYED